MIFDMILLKINKIIILIVDVDDEINDLFDTGKNV
jgi:hypothetical protein